MSDFKVGDRVRVKDKGVVDANTTQIKGLTHEIIETGTVAGTEYIRLKGIGHWFFAKDFNKDPFLAQNKKVDTSNQPRAIVFFDDIGNKYPEYLERCTHTPIDMGFASSKRWCTKCDADIKWDDQEGWIAV